MKQSFLTLLLLTAVFLGTSVNAQNFQGLGGETAPVTVTTRPEIPAPGELVHATAVSYAVDLDRSELSWFLNDTLSQRGVGKKSFSFRVGQAGSATSVLLVIKTPDGAILQKSLTFRPASVDLVWEASSYTPPFYKGKALYPYQGVVKIVALPNFVSENGSTLNEKNLVYNWTVDDKAVPEKSGFGKNSITVSGSIPLKPTFVQVEASSADSAIVAEGKVSLNPQSPGVLFYEVSPLYGTLRNLAFSGNATLQNEEIKIAAVPYFFGLKNGFAGHLVYEWLLDGKAVGRGKNTLTFREEKDARGVAAVRLEVRNPAKIFQFAQGAFSLSFGESIRASDSPFLKGSTDF